MSTNYVLANFTKREKIGFLSLAYANSDKAIIQSAVCCQLIAFYLLGNPGDRIALASMGGNTVFGENEDDGWSFTDVTDAWVENCRIKYGMA